MQTYVLAIEGVLARGGDAPLIMRDADPFGRSFYRMMVQGGANPILLSSEIHEEVSRAWLSQEGFGKYTMIYNAPPGADFTEWKVGSIRNLLGSGYNIAAYMDSDVETVRQVLDLGVNALLPVLTPISAVNRSPEYRSWYSVVDEVETARRQKAGVSVWQEDA
jgi:hypothetical protein